MKIEISIDDNLIKRFKLFFNKRNIIIVFVCVLLLSGAIIKAADVSFHVFEPNTTIVSSEINENFESIQTAVAELTAQIEANTSQIEANGTQVGENTALISQNMPAGTIVAYAGGSYNNIPDGWLLCDGTAVSRTEFSALYAAISTYWGRGNGSTTFNLPDLRGKFLRGVDLNTSEATAGDTWGDPDRTSRVRRYTGGNTGNTVGSYQQDIYANHQHEQYGWYINETAINSGDGTVGGNAEDGARCEAYYSLAYNFYTQNSGGNETRPTNAYTYFIIKY